MPILSYQRKGKLFFFGRTIQFPFSEIQRTIQSEYKKMEHNLVNILKKDNVHVIQKMKTIMCLNKSYYLLIIQQCCQVKIKRSCF